MDIQKYWQAALAQDPEAMRPFFHKAALISWHNTNEQFTVDEFIRANCEYPGSWDGQIQRLEELPGLIITVVHVYSRDKTVSCHVTSFIRIEEDQIVSMDEYWGDDGDAPQWRLDKHIGTPIHP